jgi:hypothetical protein
MSVPMNNQSARSSSVRSLPARTVSKGKYLFCWSLRALFQNGSDRVFFDCHARF